jgi:tRNA(fMet)-specific endonuclease VapC
VITEKDEICVTIITFEEQMRGWMSYLAKAKDEPKRIDAYAHLKELLDDLAGVRILTYDQEASFHFMRLQKEKLRVGTMDLRIASIVLAHSALLITRNARDFTKVTGLKTDDWTKD